ncbi:MAG: zinc-ribbon domain-containing protein, partial [Acidobacteria bacterium]|nr:zinc-ribbon domain-containing protein [Acidobacteriota bacterium]
MVITCQQCSSRLQLDDTKVPSRAFTVRCPKCQQIINAQPPSQASSAGGALAIGEMPSSHDSRFARPMPAPAFRPEGSEGGEAASADALRTDRDEIAHLLSTLLSRAMTSAASAASQGTLRRGWEHRRALVCAQDEHRFSVARVLVEGGYEVFVAEDTTQAIERMREDKMDIVLLDPKFDEVEQGAAFIRREVSALRPAARRKLFFVIMSPDVRSGDAHQA